MRKSPIVPVVILLCCLPALGSEPGQPLDCSNVQFHTPGLTCNSWIAPADCTWINTPDHCVGGTRRVTDNDGNVYRTREKTYQQDPTCFPGSTQNGVEILQFDGTTETLVAEFVPQCEGGVKDESIDLEDNLMFDPTNGRLHIRVMVQGTVGVNVTYQLIWWTTISGFTTTFDVLQTYEPTAGSIAFRVPYMPEGFQSADHFDTYYGDLAIVGDWSKAQPLECGYPTTAPAVGDYLTVDDRLPVLEPGQGRYYVTAVTYQGQTRYGRKSSGGALTGRDPSLLPQCAE